MRISTQKDDPGYSEEAHKYEAFLNGEPLPHCLTADEEKGEALVIAIDPHTGKAIADGDGLKTETVTGKVEIKSKA